MVVVEGWPQRRNDMRVHANDVRSIRSRAECVHECEWFAEGSGNYVIDAARAHTEATGHTTDAASMTRQTFFTDELVDE